MITSSGKVIEIHGQKYCATCKQIRDHTCFWMSYRKSEKNDDGDCDAEHDEQPKD